MFSALLPLLLGQISQPTDRLSVLEDHLREGTPLIAQASITSSDWPGSVQVEWNFQGKADQTFRVDGLGELARITQRGEVLLEVDLNRKQYVLTRGMPERAPPSPYVNMLAWRTYPFFLTPGWLGRSLATGRKPASKSPEPPLSSWARYDVGSVEEERTQIWLDSDGSIRHFRYDIMTQAGPSHLEYSFLTFEWAKPQPAARFDVSLPIGTSPMYAPFEDAPLPIKSPIPRGPWVSAQGKRLSGMMVVDRAPLLVFVSDPGCPVSEAFSQQLGPIQALMTEHKGKIVELRIGAISTAPKRPWMVFLDENAALEKSLRVPGTPMLYLFSPKGEVHGLWYGFVPNMLDQLKSEIKLMLENPPLDFDL